MKVFELKEFEHQDAWLIMRFEARVQNEFVDVYFIQHLPSEYILGHLIVEKELSQKQVDHLFKKILKQYQPPERILLKANDPAEILLLKSAKYHKIRLEIYPARCLDKLTEHLEQSYQQNMQSSSTQTATPQISENEKEALKYFIPDNYSPCPCNSGKKHKFCCKNIFMDISMAMTSAEEGHLVEALKWINTAKKKVGETAEVMCREAIVYSYFDQQKFHELMTQCLALHPHHPRTHYIHGLQLKKLHKYQESIAAYQKAIENYPKNCQYHLNETYHNLGGVYYDIGDLPAAKDAWEKALLYMPSDELTQKNLREFIDNKKIF